MKKFMLVAILVGILIFVEGAGVIYFVHKSQRLSEKLQKVAPGLLELQSQKQEAEKKYAELSKENDSIKKDCENLLAQAKYLMKEKAATEDLKGSLDKLTSEKNETEKKLQTEKQQIEQRLMAENHRLISEKDILTNQNKKLQGVVKQLMFIQQQAEADRNQFKEAYDKLKDKSTIEGFKKNVGDLTKENRRLDTDLKIARSEIDKLKEQNRSGWAKIDELNKSLDEYKRNYNDAVKKNKAMEQEIKNMPTKFSEIARQNTTLIKETALTHYNLGVFYTQKKEYSRAVSEFAKAVEINPDDAYAHFNLGYIYAEYMVDRKKAIEHFRHFLRLSKEKDKDTDWAKKYILTWETYEGKGMFR